MANLSPVDDILTLLKKSENLAKDTYVRVLAAKQAIEDQKAQSSQASNVDESQRSVEYLEDAVIDSAPVYSSAIEAAILDGLPHLKANLGFQKDHLDSSKQLYETILHHCTSLKPESGSSSHLEKKLAGTIMDKVGPRPTVNLALDRMKNYMDLISFQCECYFDECQPSSLNANDRHHCQRFHANVLTRKAQKKTKETERQNVVPNSRADEDANMDKLLLDKSTPAKVHQQSTSKGSPPLIEARITLIPEEVPSNSANCRPVTRYTSQEFIQESLGVHSSYNNRGSDVVADDLPVLASGSEEFQSHSAKQSRRNSSSQKALSMNFEEKENNRETENSLVRVRPSASMLTLPIMNMSLMSGQSKHNTLVSYQSNNINEEDSESDEFQSVNYSDNAARLKYKGQHSQPGLRDANQSHRGNCRGARMRRKKNIEYPVRKSSLRVSAPVLEKWTRLQVKTCIVKSKASQTEPQQWDYAQ